MCNQVGPIYYFIIYIENYSVLFFVDYINIIQLLYIQACFFGIYSSTPQ